MSNPFKITLVLLVIVVGFLLVFVAIRQSTPYRPRTQTRCVLKQVAAASYLYHESYGEWPKNTEAFTNNPKNITFFEMPQGTILDAWHRPVLYKPFQTNLGYGAAISLGRDGKPGGTGLDADIEFRFSETNAF